MLVENERDVGVSEMDTTAPLRVTHSKHFRDWRGRVYTNQCEITAPSSSQADSFELLTSAVQSRAKSYSVSSRSKWSRA